MIDKNYDAFLIRELNMRNENTKNRAALIGYLDNETWIGILLFVGKLALVQLIAFVIVYAVVENSSLK